MEEAWTASIRTNRRMRVLPLLGLLLAAGGQSQSHGGERPYSFGVVPQFDQRRLHEVWRPILGELKTKTGMRFELRGSAEIPAFEVALFSGAFDCAYMNPYHFIVANRAQGYRAVVRDHSRQLRGILVVRKDDPARSVQDLAGERIAFPAPNALGASLLMRAELGNRERVDTVPIYVKTHTSVYLNVVKGLVRAGGGVERTLRAQSPAVRDSLRILYRTRPVAPHPVACHPRVPAEHRHRLQAALLAIGQTPEGARKLARIPILRIGPARFADYEPLTDWGLDKLYEAP